MSGCPLGQGGRAPPSHPDPVKAASRPGDPGGLELGALAAGLPSLAAPGLGQRRAGTGR